MARGAPRAFACVAILVTGLSGLVAAAQDKPPAPAPKQVELAPVGYSLQRILELADRNHPNIAQARAKLMQARAQLDEAHYAPFFGGFRATGGVGIAPTVRGNSVFSPNTDASLTSNMGLAWRASVETIIPLWTFGKITNTWDAAEANVKVNVASMEVDRDAVRHDVRKAFFGLQLARDSDLLLKDVRTELDKAEAKLRESVEKDDGDPIELLKLQTYAAELEVREAEVQRYITVARAGLRFYTGVPNLDIPDEPIRAPRHQLGHVTRYLAAARLYRPEIAMARAGINAREATLQIARSGLFPNIGLLAQFGLGAAPEIANQINPFVSDPGNYVSLGFGLGFQWNLDFASQAARIRFAEGQLEEVRAQQRYALGGVGAEVEVAYAEVVDWKKRLAAYTKAADYAKKWLITVQQSLDIGTMEDKDVLEPAKAYATHKYNQLNAIMELDMAMARLAKATGWDAIAPDGT
jgi:outer membrane protein TolC